MARFRRSWWPWAAALVVVVSYPFWGGFLGTRLAETYLRGCGLTVTVTRGRAGFGVLHLAGLTVRGAPATGNPLAHIDAMDVPLAVLWRGGVVRLDGARLHLVRGGASDNVASLDACLRDRRGASTSGAGVDRRRLLPEVSLQNAVLRVEDVVRGHSLSIGHFDADIAPGRTFSFHTRTVSGSMHWHGSAPNQGLVKFGAAVLDAEGELSGLRPAPKPRIRVTDGFLKLLPALALTGIRGEVVPERQHLRIDLEGSYGGAKETLWNARGTFQPGKTLRDHAGSLSLRAQKFSLGKVTDILPKFLLDPKNTTVDAALAFRLAHGRVAFTGSLDVARLALHHERLAPAPLSDLGFAVRLAVLVDPERRRVEIQQLEGRVRNLVVTASGAVELRQGVFRFKDGREMAVLPTLELSVRVPRMDCSQLLTSIPAPMVSRLQGFALEGVFQADLNTKVDYADLDALELGGKVAIDGCRVTQAPETVERLAGPEPIVYTVDVPPLPDDPLEATTLKLQLGEGSEDFVPYGEISPHVVNALLTTEDNGFFKHRGWVTPVFKTALRRNLQGGAFLYGASSITMQMVKNILLVHDKTLARKLQELMLAWYVEQKLSKERIFELYLNAIEFGPRLYGIGAAARHYFGKPASDISPLEAAFFSSILPSPKRRYVQYCRGQLDAKWAAYVRRILKRMVERGRLTQEEYNTAATETLTFDMKARTMTQDLCLAWVRRMMTPDAAAQDAPVQAHDQVHDNDSADPDRPPEPDRNDLGSP
jgi:hypothetical protein